MGFLSNTDPREKAINQQIQQTHNQINELYLDLGRYVKLNLKDQINDQYVKNAAQNIDDCLARLQQLNNDLNSIRGIKLCVNCSAQIPVAVTFCPACGTKQPDNGMGMNGMQNMGMQGNMGMQNNMGMQGNMGMQNNMQGGFGAPVPTPMPNAAPMQPHMPAPAPTAFNPTSAGSSPANANKNKIGAPDAQPVPPMPPMNDAAPVPPMPDKEEILKDIPPVPPMPGSDANTSGVNEIPPVPPINEMPDRKPDLVETPVKAPEPEADDAPTAAPAAPAAAATGEFIFCSQCGHKEAANVAFCSQCGSKL